MRDFTSWKIENELKSDQPLPDIQIPTLAAAIDPVRLRKNLHFLSLPPWRWGELKEVAIRVLRCHSGRCTLDLTLCSATGVHQLIGKVYAPELEGWEILQAMYRISQGGFGPQAALSIPQPVAYIPELRLVLQEKVEGRLASGVFLTGNDGDRALAAERCARWLARFHAVGMKTGPVFDRNKYLMRLGSWLRYTARPGDPLSGRLARLFRRLELAAPALDRVETCACHGDYSAVQVILADRRTTTFDWDSYGVSDPNYDVARFLSGLERLALKHLGSMLALEAAAAVFLKTYIGLGRRSIKLHHVLFFKAANHLIWMNRKMAKPHWREGIEAALDESLRSLECLLALIYLWTPAITEAFGKIRREA